MQVTPGQLFLKLLNPFVLKCSIIREDEKMQNLITGTQRLLFGLRDGQLCTRLTGIYETTQLQKYLSRFKRPGKASG